MLFNSSLSSRSSVLLLGPICAPFFWLRSYPDFPVMTSERVHSSVITNLTLVIWPEMALAVRIRADKGLINQQRLFVKNHSEPLALHTLPHSSAMAVEHEGEHAASQVWWLYCRAVQVWKVGVCMWSRWRAGGGRRSDPHALFHLRVVSKCRV